MNETKQKFELKNFYGSTLSHISQLIGVFFLSFYFNFLYKVEVEFTGEKFDQNKNYIFAANHRSLNDPPLLGLFIRPPISFLAKRELFSNSMLGYLISLLSAVPVDRDNTGSSTLKLVKKILSKEAWKLVIFIEGTRSKTEFLGAPNNGAVFISRLTKTPIVPTGISYRANGKVLIKFGKPYMPEMKTPIESESNRCLKLISKLCDYKIESSEKV